VPGDLRGGDGGRGPVLNSKEDDVFRESMLNLYSQDLPRAIGFYRDVIGFEQTYRFPPTGEPRHVELRLGTSRLALSDRVALAETGLPDPTPGHPHELVVWCDGVDAAVAKLREAGSPVLIEPYNHIAGHRRAYVSDPDGNWVALVGG
jgi:lactoylglutathione lyase